jgi:hypothetical protein
VLTFLVAAVLLLMVLNLLMRIPLVREFGSALFLSVLTLLVINYEGGDGHFWAPWILGVWFSLALLKWLYGVFGVRTKE